MIRVRILIAAPLLCVTLHSAAQQPTPNSIRSKEIWQLTDDERITERLDPQKMRERAASHATAMNRLHNPGVSSVMSTATAGGTPTTLIIDGAEHPELFLPFELFGQLLRGVDTSLTPLDRQVTRAILEPKMKAFGYDPQTFWNALDASARRYFETRDDATGRATATQATATKHPLAQALQLPSDSPDSHVASCRERLLALNAARDHFGRDRFDKFLYTVVAPTLTLTSDTPGPAEGIGLRYLSGGCQ